MAIRSSRGRSGGSHGVISRLGFRGGDNGSIGNMRIDECASVKSIPWKGGRCGHRPADAMECPNELAPSPTTHKVGAGGFD